MITPSDYLTLYSTAKLTTDPLKLKELDSICKVALTHESLYRAVQLMVKVPWPIIAAIHYRESDQDFTKHLHNGDPLSARTVHVPAGRPIEGEPPFTWPESAADALNMAIRPKSWEIASCLDFMERYNGTGYQKHSVNTPYLWDYTDKYLSGLYTNDGIYDASVKESRPGAVSILKSLEAKGVSLDFSALSSPVVGLH